MTIADSLLITSVCRNDISSIEKAIKLGANVNCYGGRPLGCAIILNNIEVVEYLVERGADLNIEGSKFIEHSIVPGYTNSLKCTKALMKLGARITEEQFLTILSDKLDFKFIKLIVEGYNIDLSYKDYLFLKEAESCGNIRAVLYFLERGAPSHKLKVKTLIKCMRSNANPDVSRQLRKKHKFISFWC